MGTFDAISKYSQEPTTLAAMTAVGLTVVWLAVRSRRVKLPPGPRGWPVIGNLLDFEQKGKLMFHIMAEMGKKYGGIFTVRLGLMEMVVLTKKELIYEVLVKKQNDFAGRPSYLSSDIMTGGGKDIAYGDYGQVWKLQRRLVHGALRKFLKGEQLEMRIRQSMDSFTELLKKEKGPVEPLMHISLLIYNIISNKLFGKQWAFDDPEFIKLKEGMEDMIQKMSTGLPGDFVPILKYVPSKKEKEVRAFMGELYGFLRGHYKAHEATYDPDNESDITYHLIGVKKEAEKEGDAALSQVTEEHWFQILNDFFLAGTDTTRYTLHWAVAFLAANPEVQRKAREEVDRISDPTVPVTLDMRSSLPYIEAVYSEVLRMRPLLPLSLEHKATCDTSIDGHAIPKGTTVLVNLWAMQNDPAEWKDPDVFNPERFLDENGKMIPKPSSYMPFSAGRRVCLGEVLAKAELHYILALLLQRFTLEVPEGGKVVPEFVANDFQSMCKPYKVLFKPRF